MIPVQPYIAAMTPYGLAKMTPPTGKPLISLAQNESFRPPSPLAVEAGQKALHDAEAYPDPEWHDLRSALSEFHGIPASGILCGAGSLDLIGCLARVYAGHDRSVLTPVHAYPFFRSAALIAGARFDTAEENGTTVSVDHLLEAVKPDTGLVFVANPGNPTGTCISKAELGRLREGLPPDVLLVIDEAYGEFAVGSDASVFDLVTRGDTVILRTFSKAYGLAGCRVGWGLFPDEIAAQMRKVMNPNNVTSAAQTACRAALTDQDYMRETCQMIDTVKIDVMPRLISLGIDVQHSFANFLLLDFGTAKRARDADTALKAAGIFLRAQAGAGLPNCLRMTIGPRDHVDAAVRVLERHMSEVSA